MIAARRMLLAALPLLLIAGVLPAPGDEAPGPAGKRVGPPDVAPVLIDGVRIEAIHWGGSRGFGQNGGYIAAIDPVSGRELWTLKVYDVPYDPSLEEDVQDVFIARLAAKGDRLQVIDEKGRRFLVDVKRRAVLPG
jgi:hypothetical protein